MKSTHPELAGVPNIGKRLRHIRMARGESMSVAKAVRDRFGVKLDASYLSRMERGRVEIPLRTLFALSAYYGVNPADVIQPDRPEEAGPLREVFALPELKLALETLYADFGKEQLAELLWWYFRILARTTEIREDRERAARKSLVEIVTSQNRRPGRPLADQDE